MNPSAEFDLVEQLRSLSGDDPGVVLGIGDDAAIIAPRPDHHLVCCVDTLIEGVHFPSCASARSIGHKSLAVNLSDLAAMGARPRWALMSLSLAEADSQWLQEFIQGWRSLAKTYSVALIGGDTTRTPGPLSISVQLMGELPRGKALLRSGATVGDQIAVTGSLGGAARALQQVKGGASLSELERRRLDFPTPRVEAGAALLPLASACIDLSDGLAADLPHLLNDSGVGARIDLDALPLDPLLSELSAQHQLDLALGGGDDYELCFCYPTSSQSMICGLFEQLGVGFSTVGEICAEANIRWEGRNGRPIAGGYGHFND